MRTQMNWQKLLNPKRFYWPQSLPEESRPTEDALIDVFQADSSRITNSSAYHRLQNKTQVLPFPKADYPRTRLTHTNEVSDCGRELARMIGRELEEQGVFTFKETAVCEDIVSAACKAHDLGNPPFGHSGEFAIQDWARKNIYDSSRNEKFAGISEEKRKDLACFDGNAQGFRILTITNGWRRQGGLQLTYAVIAAFCKYPWSSEHEDTRKLKYCVPTECIEMAKSVFVETGLIEDLRTGRWSKHPLAYIVEAADDISYITSDLEDAARADVGSREKILGYYERLAKDAIKDPSDRKTFVKRQGKIADGEPKALLRYLKDHAQRALKIAARDAFLDNYPKIMVGNFKGALLDASRVAAIVREAKDYMRDFIYDDVGKVRHEVFGSCVITSLLDYYANVLFDFKSQVVAGRSFGHGDKMIDESLRRGVITFPLDNYISSGDYGDITKAICSVGDDSLMQMAVDYVSGMTDPYAVLIYQQLFGIQRPSASW